MSQLHIDSPCHEDWSRMTPTERGRHCAKCSKEVLDLTKSSASAARREMAAIQERLQSQPAMHVCVRGENDGRGRVLTPAHRRLLTNAFAAMVAMTVAGCTGSGPAVGERTDTAQTEQTTEEPTKFPLQELPETQQIELPGIELQTEEKPIVGTVIETGGCLEAQGDVEVAPRPVVQPVQEIHWAGGIRAVPHPETQVEVDPGLPKENG
jgi:hypothetical protein